ncbi:hypothetical protein AVEN_187611-1 [Araneus ventricosus]|uniref:Uncharacterized protein n=1 Tax=Araneus ventricosus TaxID=182803 RepID=A0A4Y2S380_ARAVE|nr:hypothetical protein AVEN_187611-1 [Araneus ventricosus]
MNRERSHVHSVIVHYLHHGWAMRLCWPLGRSHYSSIAFDFIPVFTIRCFGRSGLCLRYVSLCQRIPRLKDSLFIRIGGFAKQRLESVTEGLDLDEKPVLITVKCKLVKDW